MKLPYKLWIAPFIAIFFALASTPILAQDTVCGALENPFGPYDYRTERGNNLYLVEMAHFTPPVESLIRGNTGKVGGDLDYTLRAFPNHHRALMSVMRFGEKTKSTKPPDMRYSVECYLDRAIRFRPDDSIARMIYSMFLAKAGRTKEAVAQLDTAAEFAEDKENPFTHYNLGLNYLDVKEYDKALIQAHKAYGLGFIQPGLKDRLTEAGKWKEPATESPDASAAPASAPK
jgi:tetratricopeptide (TPR) repeat protein